MYQKFLLILFSIGFILSAQSQESGNNGFLVRIGDEAPHFTAKLTDGKIFNLKEQRGKIVMLQFTASWCGVCRREMPYIEKDIVQKLKGKKIYVVGIDRDEPLDVILDYQKQMKISYPLALDPQANIFGLYADLLSGVTRNVVIDENGKIIYLSRLFDIDEFNEMAKVIYKAVERLQE
jgi:peroxiredoxin